MTWAHIALALSPFVVFDIAAAALKKHHNPNTPTSGEAQR